MHCKTASSSNSNMCSAAYTVTHFDDKLCNACYWNKQSELWEKSTVLKNFFVTIECCSMPLCSNTFVRNVQHSSLSWKIFFFFCLRFHLCAIFVCWLARWNQMYRSIYFWFMCYQIEMSNTIETYVLQTWVVIFRWQLDKRVSLRFDSCLFRQHQTHSFIFIIIVMKKNKKNSFLLFSYRDVMLWLWYCSKWYTHLFVAVTFPFYM